MSQEEENSLIGHLEALRKTLLRIVLVTVLLYPAAFCAAPYVIRGLVQWCFPPQTGGLHYFSPMEVFWVELQLALILAIAAAYPWNILQIWKFLLPALYLGERRALGWWIIFSSVLFFGGVVFCGGVILPMLMEFSGSFASAELKPMIGLANFLELAGWLMLSFGIMFQAPIAVMLLVRFGILSTKSISNRRPYVMTGILILAAILTPPDIVSQVMLAVPTWLLFETGLFFAKKMEEKNGQT